MSVEELVKELRSWADCDARSGEPLGARMRKAADKLEELAAALAEKDKEIAALREALEKIAKGYYDGIEVTHLSSRQMRDIARAALKEVSDERS